MKSAISFQSAFEALPTPCLVLLPDAPKFTIVEANCAYLEIAWKEREDIIGKGFFDVFPPSRYPANTDLDQIFREVISTKKPVKTSMRGYDIPVRGTTGTETRYFETVNTPVLSPGNTLEYILRSVREGTDIYPVQGQRKTTRARHQRHEKLLMETQRIASVGSWEVDMVHSKIHWSEVMRKIFEVEPDYEPDFEGSLLFFKEGESRDTIVEVITKAIESGEIFDVTLPIITAKGNERWFRCTGIAENRDGRCLRLYGTTQNITDRKDIEQSLLQSRNRLNALVQSVDGIVWEADADTFEFSFISNQVSHVLGYSPEEWLGKPGFWETHIYKEDRARTLSYFRHQISQGENLVLDYRMTRSDGNFIRIKDRVSIITENGKPRWLRGLMMDVSEAKRSEDLESLEKKVLELNSQVEVPLEEILMTYVKGIEALFPLMKCTILRIRDNRMYNWAAGSISRQYVKSIDNYPIGNNMGSCGTAAFIKETVIVSNISKDPRWEGFRHLALKYRLKACWSVPIINTLGEVLATFGMYYQEVRSPNKEELRVIDRANSILKIILESHQKSDILEESAFLMTQSQEMAHFGNWQWNILTNVVSWSDNLYEIYGLTPKSFKATFEGYLELLHPDDRGRIYRLILETIKTKQDTEFEERIIRPSGEIRFLKSWARVKTDEKGNATRLIGACLDITKSKVIAEKLQASETRLRNLVDAQTNYVIRLDLSGKFTYANRRYIEDFGRRVENNDLIGTEIFETIKPIQHSRIREISKSCIENPNTVFQIELDIILPDREVKSTFWHFICLVDSVGKPAEIQGIGIDVSKRKKAEDALNLSNERYEYANRATQDAIFDWDIPGDHVEWGAGFQRLFGHETPQGGNAMENWAVLIHPEDSGRMRDSLKKALAKKDQDTWLVEYRLRQADGSFAYVEENDYILRNTRGRAIRMIGAVRNITERKLAEKRLQELHMELEDSLKVLAVSNRELEQFAYVASHDLQEPLRMITGFLTQLEKKYKDNLDEKAQKYIFFAVDGAKRMRQIILDILDYSRVGRMEDAGEDVDLDELVGEIVGLYRETIQEKHARVVYKNLPVLEVARTPMSQIFQNLISNALKYQKALEPARIHISAKETPTHWRFSVSDNGIGIDPEYFDRIFIIFQRLHNRDEYSGTGMGLAITKKIVESLGGKIWVESQEGKGSTFYFTIEKMGKRAL